VSRERRTGATTLGIGFARRDLRLSRARVILRAAAQKNVERARVALDAVNRGDQEAILDLVDAEVVWVADRSDMGRTTYHGREGVRQSFEELSEGFERFGFEADELIDAGDRVVAIGRMYGRGRVSEIRAEILLDIVVTLGSNGKLVRYESFRDPADAMRAAGFKSIAEPDS
jgi:ketosteroid isomerase-like protein